MGIAPNTKLQRPPAANRSRHRWATAVAGLVIALFLWFAWRHFSEFQWSRFRDALATIDHLWLLAGLGIAIFSYSIRAARWQIMILPAKSSFWNVFRATLVGFSAIVLLGRAGELVRPYLIARRENTRFSVQAAAWVLERLYDLLAILLLFGIGVSHARKLGVEGNSTLAELLRLGGWIVVAGSVLTGGLLYIIGRHPTFFRRRFSEATTFLSPLRHERFLTSIDSFLAGASASGKPLTFLLCMALTLAEWAAILASMWCYFLAFPPTSDSSLLDVAAFLGFVAFGAVVQLPGIGGGMQIASVVVLTQLFRLPVEQASSFALVVWAGSNLVVLPLGIPLAFYEGFNRKEWQRMQVEAAL